MAGAYARTFSQSLHVGSTSFDHFLDAAFTEFSFNENTSGSVDYGKKVSLPFLIPPFKLLQ